MTAARWEKFSGLQGVASNPNSSKPVGTLMTGAQGNQGSSEIRDKSTTLESNAN